MKKIYLLLSNALFWADVSHASPPSTEPFSEQTFTAQSPAKTSDTEQHTNNAAAIRWQTPPNIRLSSHDLREIDRDITLTIYANGMGKVTRVIIEKSSGLAAVDQKVVRAVYRASFQPYQENGIAQAFFVTQPINLKNPSALTTQDNTSGQTCHVAFNSWVWSQQIAGVTTAFRYKKPLPLSLDPKQLQGQDRHIDLQFKLSRNNVISDVKLLKSSGDHTIDKEVLHIFANYAEINAKPKFWQFYKRTMTDQIQLKLHHCSAKPITQE
ncbi:energy transducer TonB family protein [Acinetobacter larvae]|uniref:TonB C-terminal domain-containing protein n=1 Tax=Acinetobacter larvae TaxID=1789224 RepID=A0A1B2M1T5_9GAMM|nr:energy transducer TonB [Acinetobacter larvae]AOA59160.1 hypothetical protein BFG52_12900 [Acinetobacter larvae]